MIKILSIFILGLVTKTFGIGAGPLLLYTNPNALDPILGYGIRLEAEEHVGLDVSRWKTNFTNSNHEVENFQFKPWYHHIFTYKKINPYVGAGISLNFLNVDTLEGGVMSEYRTQDIGLHLMAGINFSMNESVKIFTEFDYEVISDYRGPILLAGIVFSI